MKVGTDGVLLGSWARVDGARRILDIGTGTGLLAIMAAQRNSTAQIDALEIEPEAYAQACENVLATPWAHRISVVHSSLQTFSDSRAQPLGANSTYDCILCNPPYFNNTFPSANNAKRNLARHNTTLPLCDLALNIGRLLTPDFGTASIILPNIEAQELISLSKAHKLHPRRITHVKPTPSKPPKRWLVQLGSESNSVGSFESTIEDELIIEYARHQYSPEYAMLMKDFFIEKGSSQ